MESVWYEFVIEWVDNCIKQQLTVNNPKIKACMYKFDGLQLLANLCQSLWQSLQYVKIGPWLFGNRLPPTKRPVQSPCSWNWSSRRVCCTLHLCLLQLLVIRCWNVKKSKSLRPTTDFFCSFLGGCGPIFTLVWLRFDSWCLLFCIFTMKH